MCLCVCVLVTRTHKLVALFLDKTFSIPSLLCVFSDEVYEGDFTIGDHDSK